MKLQIGDLTALEAQVVRFAGIVVWRTSRYYLRFDRIGFRFQLRAWPSPQRSTRATNQALRHAAFGDSRWQSGVMSFPADERLTFRQLGDVRRVLVTAGTFGKRTETSGRN